MTIKNLKIDEPGYLCCDRFSGRITLRPRDGNTTRCTKDANTGNPPEIDVQNRLAPYRSVI